MKTLNFTKMGMDISDADYTGDIGNHRVRAEFTNENGVNFFVEVCSTGIKRRTSNVTGQPLKKIIDVSHTNGMRIEILALYMAPEKSCVGTYYMHQEEKTLYSQVFDTKECHKKNRVLMLIQSHTGEWFDEMTIS